MADYNRNRGGYGSSYQDWNEEGDRYNRERSYDDRGYGNRSESGNYGGTSGRYGQDYGEGSTYGYGRYNSESDYNRENYGRQSGRYDRDYDQGYRGRTYGGLSDLSRGFGSTRYDRDYTNYAPGGYQNFGGGTGYGGSYFSGGYGGTSYGRPLGTRGYESDYGIYSDSYQTGGYGDMRNRSRWDQNRGYGSSEYGSMYGTGYRNRDREKEWNPDRNWWDRTTDEVSSWFGDEDAERRRKLDRLNSHRGKGPRNYQRSDDRIKEDINDKLSDDWLIDATDIEVSVQNGEVTLTGSVDDRMAKRRAEDIAEDVSGVRNVENRIRVNRESMYGSMGATGTATTGTTTTGATERKGRSNLVTDTGKT